MLGAASSGNLLGWWENDGSENFGTVQTIASGFSGAASITADDIDGDSDIDVISGGNGTVAWYDNNGSEVFSLGSNIITSYGQCNSVSVKDVDGDGYKDVVSSSFDNDRVDWHENDGAGGFTTHQIPGTYSGPQCVYACDLDNDSDIDIVTALRSGNEFRWLENDGSESFTGHQLASAAGAYWAYATDVDSDGDVDLLGTALNANVIAWFESDANPLAGGVSKDVQMMQWEFIGIPVNVVDGDALTLFGDDLGTDPGPPNWRLSQYRFYPSVQYIRYGEPDNPVIGPDIDPPDFTPGQGYWLYQEVANPVTLDIDPGQITGVVNQSVPYDVNCSTAGGGIGWWQMANPFNYTYDWRSTYIYNTSEIQKNIYEAAQAGWVTGYGQRWDVSLQDYEQVSYLPSATSNYTIDAWEGIWFNVLGSDDYSVLFTPASMLDGAPFTQEEIEQDRANQAGWEVKLEAYCGNRQNADNKFGVKAASSDAYDFLDAPEMTPPTSSFVQLYFPHDEWEEQAGDYTYDFRAAGSSKYEWEFAVRVYNKANQQVEVAWPDLSQLPSRANAVITGVNVDMEPVNMREVDSFTFTAGNTMDAEYNFKVKISDETVIFGEGELVAVPAEFGLTQAYPNPFNNEITIDYTVEGISEITLAVFDVLGREIAVLSSGNINPGAHSIIWNAEGQSTGIYFVKLTEGNSTDLLKAVLIK